MPTEIVILRAHLLQSCKDFFIANQINPRDWTHNRHTGEDVMDTLGGAILSFDASKWEEHKPLGYIADIGIGSNRLVMPPSILFSLLQSAGYIFNIDCTVPLDPVSFDEMMSICHDIGDLFEKAGFKLKSKRKPPTEEIFLEKGGLRDQYGQWTHDDPFPMRVTLEFKNFNRLPITSFTTPLADPTPANSAPTYLIDIIHSLENEVSDELISLKKARRFALTGDQQKGIPVKIWFDDPNWRPEGWQGKWLT